MHSDRKFDRRTLLGKSLTMGAGMVTASLFPSILHPQAPNPIVPTRQGKLRGAMRDQIAVFKGIPYGASTTGANRFMPPKRPESWSGVRDALSLGPIAPQASDPRFARGETPNQSEDCLVLNVWTPALGNQSKLPVMVWIHGGGFQVGSGWDPNTDGHNLARSGNVVVVSLNHRLNAFGFLYLGELNKRFADSGNVGMLDIVRALEWVHENIAPFGGDPDRVLIFGESGGAGKVSTLMAMPAAKGLFHRAVGESGVMPRVMPPSDATKIAVQVLDQLAVDRRNVSALQQLPAERLIAAYTALTKLPFTSGARMIWKPVNDGRSVPAQPFDPVGPACSADVPMIMGSNKTELTAFFQPSSVTESNLTTMIMDNLHVDSQNAQQLIESYRSRRPGASPYDLFIDAGSDGVFRRGTIEVAEAKAAQKKAAAYVYLMSWETNVRNLGTPHGLDVGMIFRQLDPNRPTGTDPSRFAMSDVMSNAWVAFAYSGNPNHAGMPEWKPFTKADRAIMIFDKQSKLVNDPQNEDRIAQEKMPPFDM